MSPAPFKSLVAQPSNVAVTRPVTRLGQSGDRFVRFGSDEAPESLREAALEKAKRAYKYYQSLPRTEDEFVARLNQIIQEKESERPGKRLTAKKKQEMEQEFAHHIINQWINVEELFMDAIDGYGYPDSIRPEQLAAPDFPNISSEMVHEIAKDPKYKADRYLKLDTSVRSSGPATPDAETGSPRFFVAEG